MRLGVSVSGRKAWQPFAVHDAKRMSALGLRAAWIDRVYADLLRPKLLGQHTRDYVEGDAALPDSVLSRKSISPARGTTRTPASSRSRHAATSTVAGSR